MTTRYLDPTTPPPVGANSRLDLQTVDDVIIGIAIDSANGLGIQLADTTADTVDQTKLRIISAGSVFGQTGAIEIVANGAGTTAAPNYYTIVNDGTIEGLGNGSYGIKVTEVVGANGSPSKTGALKLENSGTISARGIAVSGGSEGDVIINTRKIESTGLVAIDLGKGHDLYDGRSGTVTGMIKLGEGDDTAYGGASNEIFEGGVGNDLIDGGGGSDWIDYSAATAGISVNLGSTAQQNIGGEQGSDTLINIENLTGSTHNDTLIGSNADNRLEGGDGHDFLEGGAGNDTLVGGAGNDTVRYSGSSSSRIDLSDQTLQYISSSHGSDMLIGIENVEAGSGADIVIGSDANNVLSGGSGNDTLTGGKGNDTLEGGAGTDYANFTGTKSQYTITHNGDGSITVTDTVANRDGVDILRDIRFLRFSDTLHPLSNAAPQSISLSRTSAAEDLRVGSSVGTLDGDDPDDDSLTYSLVSNPNNMFSISGTRLILNKALDFETATSHTIQVMAKDAYGGQKIQTFTINVTNVYETIPTTKSGTGAGERVIGEYGNDRVFGFGGNDTIFGQAGNDSLYGGDGDDYVIGGDGTAAASGDDWLYGGNGRDTLAGGNGRDIFVFDTRPNTRTNLDFINDFSSADDTIHLLKSAFSTLKKGTLAKSAFVVGSKVHDKDDRIIYVKSQGALFYDPDGTGKKAAIQFASVQKNLALSHKDFFIF